MPSFFLSSAGIGHCSAELPAVHVKYPFADAEPKPALKSLVLKSPAASYSKLQRTDHRSSPCT
jgi:hypothetical protein